MRKIVFVKNLSAVHIEQVQNTAPNWDVIYGKEPEVWLPHLKEAEIVCGWNRHVAELCVKDPTSKLRWFHNWGAGVDQLPFDILKQRNIVVTNSSGVHAYPISETVLAMMLALTRRIQMYVRQQQSKEWHHANLSLEMHGKTVGILGVGAIGLEIARLCQAFHMRVIGLTRAGTSKPSVDQMVDKSRLHDLLRESDYVVNTLPLTAESAGMIGEREFQVMKDTSFYVNIGRGETTDEAALVHALQAKEIAGAGLDVFATEPLPQDSPLWDMDNVILTPHTSGSTEHYDQRVLEIFLPNLAAYVRGQEPAVNRVDLDLQY